MSNSSEDMLDMQGGGLDSELNLMNFLNRSISVNLTAQLITTQYLDESNLPYYGDYFTAFRKNYLQIHGWVSLIVCIFGILANILNIIVLTRKDMISPTNAILTGLAAADMFVMISYLPFSIHNYIRQNQTDEVQYSYGWAVFTLIHAHWTVACHTISSWLTVALAVWRFLVISFPGYSKKWCSMTRAKFAIICTYFNCAVFCLPVYITFTITKFNKENSDVNIVLYISKTQREIVEVG